MRCESWRHFREVLDGYFSVSSSRRQQLIFRGQPDAGWGLTTTLDRSRQFDSDSERERVVDALLDEFRREAVRLGLEGVNLPHSEALELLGRHHGLPSPILDWTESPFIASFFAFEEATHAGDVAIWVLDRAKCDAQAFEAIQIIEDIDLLQFNRRALQQRGVFVRVLTATNDLATLIPDAVHRFTVPARDRTIALTELDEMTINAAYLFEDAGGAARTSVARMGNSHE